MSEAPADSTETKESTDEQKSEVGDRAAATQQLKKMRAECELALRRPAPEPPSPELLSAAEELGQVYALLYGLQQLPLGNWVEPGVGPVSKLDPALTFVYEDIPANNYRMLDRQYRQARYKSAYDTVVPVLYKASLAAANDTLALLECTLKRLYDLVGQSEVGERLHTAAAAVSKLIDGVFGNTDDELRAALAKYGGKPPTLAADYFAFKKDLEARRRARISVAMREVADPLLSIIFAHPLGVDIVARYAERAGNESGLIFTRTGGTEVAQAALIDAREATTEFRRSIADDKKAIWRFPPLLMLGVARLGLTDVPAFPLFVSALGGVLGASVLKQVLNTAGYAMACLGLLFPPGEIAAVVVGVLDIALVGSQTTLSYLEEKQQELGASASDFSPETEKLAQHPDFSETSLLGALTLLAVFTFVVAVKALPRRAAQVADELPPPDPLTPKRERYNWNPETRRIEDPVLGDVKPVRAKAKPVKTPRMRARTTAVEDQAAGVTDESRAILNKNTEERGLPFDETDKTRARQASWFDQQVEAAKANQVPMRKPRTPEALPDVGPPELDPHMYQAPPPVETPPVRGFEPVAHPPTPDRAAGTALAAEHVPTRLTKVRGTDRFGVPMIDPVQDIADSLRAAATPEEWQVLAKSDLPSTMPDPAYPHLTVGTATADHVVSVSRIMQKRGFERLSRQSQLRLLTMEENYAAVSARVNNSKQELSYFEWGGVNGSPPDKKWLQTMQAQERAAEKAIDAELARLLAEEEQLAAGAAARANPLVPGKALPVRSGLGHLIPTGEERSDAGVAP
jgi:hypothetical protein